MTNSEKTKLEHSQRNQYSNFLIIWIGELVSTIGTGLTGFALGIYAFNLTGQATSATMVVLLTFLPAFLLRPFGGVLADRIDRRLLMIVGNLGYALGIGLVFFVLTTRPGELWMIYPGIAISSVFFAVLSPAYKATVTDLVPQELYGKASGLVQLSGSAQFLLAPLIAGVLMSIVDISYIIMLDIITSILSAVAILFVRRTVKHKITSKEKTEAHFLREMREGFKAVVINRGIVILITVTSLILFYIGLLQALFTPMGLSFTDPRTLGTAQSVCAIGMLISSVIIGMFWSKRKHALVLSVALALMGIFYSFIGVVENIWAIIIPGFLFFFTVPFVNSSIEVLIRQNVSNEKQGRVWSLISVITNVGAMIAYATAGFLADRVFNPLLMPDGALASSFGQIFGVGPGRGIAFIFFISGLIVVLLSVVIYRSRSISELDNHIESVVDEGSGAIGEAVSENKIHS
ncbi:MFS transporter [Bacillus horti]|uniref:MFS family permease n=1 Tax=Caldalkalibacillus horti TaxID=77523 RepID=A0ABT9VUT9_9BACI|nr:MFS transporter [Bacillus horti]MDQ0164755.1 MFS family permease [Bacillus horti]